MYTLTNLFEALPISSTTDVSLSNLSDYPRKCSLKSFLSLFNIIIKKKKKQFSQVHEHFFAAV